MAHPPSPTPPPPGGLSVGTAESLVPDACPSLHETRAAVPATVPLLRRSVRRWTEAAGLDPDVAEAVVLAVDEAVTNAVEHGHRHRPGRVGLQLTRADGGQVTAVVADGGTWRPVPDDPGFRGRGLLLIDRLADHAYIAHGPGGTTVTMRWNDAA